MPSAATREPIPSTVTAHGAGWSSSSTAASTNRRRSSTLRRAARTNVTVASATAVTPPTDRTAQDTWSSTRTRPAASYQPTTMATQPRVTSAKQKRTPRAGSTGLVTFTGRTTGAATTRR